MTSVFISAAMIRQIAPGASDFICGGIVENVALFDKYALIDPIHLKHFFGQTATETRGFTSLEESLYYTTAARLKAVWPSRFKSDTDCKPYLRNPEALANKVYSARLGNGSEASGDGWRYRGSGVKQTTGKANFEAVEKAARLPVVANPELLRSFPVALEAGLIYWRDNKLSRFADANDIEGLTRAIQGGDGGLADRRIYTERAGRVFNTSTAHAIFLRAGSRGSDVIELQTMLVKLGYDVKVNGIFDDDTENDVRDFQTAFKAFPVDGIVGATTWRVMKNATLE